MPYQVNIPISVSHNGTSIIYFSSSKHRGLATNEISVWEIDIDTELICFTSCYQNSWHTGGKGWSFVAGGIRKLSTLGYNLRNQELIIAKFVEDQNQWHGYPADIRHKPGDKPLPNILANWFNNGFISKSLMTRIKQGQI